MIMAPTTATSPVPTKRGHRRGRRPRRLLLFVHYNKWGNLADYVLYLLKRIRKVYDRVVFISNSPVSPEALKSLNGLFDDFLQRENTGFDFGAWKDALVHEGPSRLAEYDSVTLMNDTCFGPLFNLENVYRHMEAQEADFWGLTNHASSVVDKANLLGTDGFVPQHIQSYFLCFQQSAVSSNAFQTFWDGVCAEKRLEDVIRKYETKLTGHLQKGGLKAAVLCDTTTMSQRHPNKTVLEPEILMDHGVPFLKIKAFFAWKPAENALLFFLLRQHSHYPQHLIRNHLESHFSPETSIQVLGHGLEENTRQKKGGDSQRIALHIHAFYVDVLGQLLGRFSRYVDEPVDIYLTADSEEKAAQIRQLLESDFPQLHVRELLVVENRGRDIWPWLKVAPRLMDYDFVGHMHTKKAPYGTSREILLWWEELSDCLLGRFTQIKKAFASDPALGIVIPDIPSFFRCPPFPYQYYSDEEIKSLLPRIWERLGCSRLLDFSSMGLLVFPYGNMFWYRPKALEPLWNARWKRADIPAEPVPPNGTLLHALERLLVYVAWDQGYGFRIVQPKIMLPPGFQSELAFCAHRKIFPTPKAPHKNTKAYILETLRIKMRDRFPKEQHHNSVA